MRPDAILAHGLPVEEIRWFLREGESEDFRIRSQYNAYRNSDHLIKARVLDFKFATPDELTKTLGQRLKALRLSVGLQQAEVAQRAGLSLGTVKTLERSGQCTMQSMVRVAQALGCIDDLQNVFERRIQSIADMERAAQAPRQRAPRKSA